VIAGTRQGRLLWWPEPQGTFVTRSRWVFVDVLGSAGPFKCESETAEGQVVAYIFWIKTYITHGGDCGGDRTVLKISTAGF
jgi:hypothetical protein